jgi:DNA polymerase III delta prime subunit
MNNFQPPAQLIVGTTTQLLEYVELFLQKKFCKRTQESGLGCFCNECRKIKNRQHQNIVWITPEKDYTVDDVQIIFERIRFTLDPDESFFFILDSAQRFTVTTANRILKVLEEPARGYHFVLLSTNAETLLPTIVSRCVLIDLSIMAESRQEFGIEEHPLLAYFFSSIKHKDPLGFEQELKKQALNDAQSFELLQRMISFYSQKLRDGYQQATLSHIEQEYLTHVIDFLIDKMRKPPQSGSSDLFWKHLFLSFPEK